MKEEVGHWLIYGESGSGKSSCAATWPKPLLGCFFDPLFKERPYLYTRSGKPRGVITREVEGAVPVDEARGDTGNLLVRIEHYLDADVKNPRAYADFLARMSRIHDDIQAWKIVTLVIDSVTFMELAARKEQQYRLNPTARDPRQWFNGSTDTLEEVLMINVGTLPINVVVIAHIDEQKDDLHGTMVRNPAAPGRLRKRGAGGYSEVYRAYVHREDNGDPVYAWQTRSDQFFNALSLFNVPNPCAQGYKELWTR